MSTEETETRLVAVRVNGQVVGVDLERVEEVARIQSVTRVSPAPSSVCGVANLRGDLITLIDIASVVLGENATDPTPGINVIVGGRTESVGLVADELVGVMDTTELSQQPAPRHEAEGRGGLIRSIVQLESELMIVIDLDAVLAASL